MNKQNWIRLIFGMKGFGKTYHARKLVSEIPRTLIMDVTNDFKAPVIYTNAERFTEHFHVLQALPDFEIALKFRYKQEYITVLEFIDGHQIEDFHLVVDEVQQFASPSGFYPPVFENFFTMGRHRRLNMTVITQRPYKVHPTVRSQADEVITFYQKGKRDLALLHDEFGFDPNVVSNLQRFEWVSNKPLTTGGKVV